MNQFIEFFAGVGGFRRGLEATGQFQCVYANDIDPKCAMTYNLNFPTPHLTIMDIETIDSHTLPRCNLVVGGFPCQSFSVAGKRLGFDDPRGNLFFTLMRHVDYIQPEMILFENVKNLVSHENGNTLNIILERIRQSGYHVKFQVLNTCRHTDIPQNRERVFLFGHKNPDIVERFQFPSILSDCLTIQDILDRDVPEKYYYTERYKVYDEIQKSIDEEFQMYQYRRHYVRKNEKNMVPTLTANMGSGGHNVPLLKDAIGIRKLTPRETFRLQGMGDYQLPPLSDNDLYHQAGNAVTATLIQRIAESILRSLV